MFLNTVYKSHLFCDICGVFPQRRITTYLQTHNTEVVYLQNQKESTLAKMAGRVVTVKRENGPQDCTDAIANFNTRSIKFASMEDHFRITFTSGNDGEGILKCENKV
jgi:hypothetical protein